MDKKIPEKDILYYTKSLNQLITADFNKRLSDCGLTCQQGRVLFYINRCNVDGVDVHQNDIEKRFNLSKSTVSELVKRMQKNDLIEKVNNPPYCVLKATEKGKSIVDNIHQNRQRTIDKLLDGFNQKEHKELLQMLERLIENMRREEIGYVEEN